MKQRIGLFGFGHSIKSAFFDSKETRLEKVIRRSYKLKNRWAPEFLEVEVEDLEDTTDEYTEWEANRSATASAERDI